MTARTHSYSLITSSIFNLACENSRPSSLPARVAFRETPLGPGAKKDGCFRRLYFKLESKSLLVKKCYEKKRSKTNDNIWYALCLDCHLSINCNFPLFKICLYKVDSQRDARVTSAEQLGITSKNNLKGITLGVRSIWGIHPLTLIFSRFGTFQLQISKALSSMFTVMALRPDLINCRETAMCMGPVTWIYFRALNKAGREAAWSSGLGRWIWNLEVPGSNPPPYCYLDLFSVVMSSTPRPDVSRFAYKSIRLHRGRFAYTTKSFRLHGLSRFAYIQVVSPTVISRNVFVKNHCLQLPGFWELVPVHSEQRRYNGLPNLYKKKSSI